MRRILIFAPINLGLIDGSAIWLKSMLKLLSLTPNTKVHLLAHVCPLGVLPKVEGASRVFYPSDYLLTNSGKQSLSDGMRITAANAADAVQVLNRLYGYDYVVVRGVKEATALCNGLDIPIIPYLTDVFPDILLQPTDDSRRTALQNLLDTAPMVLCQTPELRALYEQVAPSVSQKITFLPPMLPDDLFTGKKPAKRKDRIARLVYAGKFSLGWGIQDLIKLSQDLTAAGAACELHIFGDKIHAETEEFVTSVKKWFESDAITYHGAVDRPEILRWLRQADIGFAYRSRALTATPEISTKLLEYIATGTLPLVNRNSRHEAYLGKDYPYFADSYDELLDATTRAISSTPAERKRALKRASEKLINHRISNIARNVEKAFKRQDPITLPWAANAARPHLLLAGHDLKFMNHLRTKVIHPKNFEMTTQVTPSFRDTGGELPRPLRDYDFIFCEWALGSAAYYSHAKLEHQRLIVRFHRVEITTDLPQKIHVPGIDKVVFVSDHLRRDALAQYGWPEEKTCVIPNMIDVNVFDRPKTVNARFNLGILGILPQLKRLDIALDLLEEVRREDGRYQLHIKGKMPWDLAWVWSSPEQRAFFQAQLDRIRNSPLLRDGIVFDPFGPDTPRWFEKIGWVLSPSDIESFHLAAIEGMASGSVPVVIRRKGADEVFPKKYVHTDMKAMAKAILSANGKLPAEEETRTLKKWAAAYDIDRVAKIWAELFTESYKRR